MPEVGTMTDRPPVSGEPSCDHPESRRSWRTGDRHPHCGRCGETIYPPIRPPVSGEPHVHEWKREYAPNYRQASEADDWREECACGAFRSGTDRPPVSGEPRTDNRTDEQIKAESCNCWASESTEHALDCPYGVWMSGYAFGYDRGREYAVSGGGAALNVERLEKAMSNVDRPKVRAMDFARCPVCDNMAVVRLPDDWQEQKDRAIPKIACGNPWHYATRSLGDS